jgi:hypothetical protein
MKDQIPFTANILNEVTKTLTVLHDLLSDVTTRGDLMAQEIDNHQQRIAELEKMIHEKDNPRQPARYPSEYKEWFRRARLNSENL